MTVKSFAVAVLVAVVANIATAVILQRWRPSGSTL